MTYALPRLGKKAVKLDSRTLKLAAYGDVNSLPAPPTKLDLTAGIGSWPMYANDQHGDCTCVSAAHMIEVWTLQTAGSPRLFQDSDVLALYGLVNGGQDEGAAELDVLRTWRSTGLAGDKILAFAAVGVSNLNLFRTALWLFSGLYVGLNLPLTARGQDVWTIGTGPDAVKGSWGGHAVNLVGYDPQFLYLISWGKVMRMTWDFWNTYGDEAYCVIPNEYAALPAQQNLSNGFNLDQLKADLALIGPEQ